MSEWLDLMLEEIARKKAEAEEAQVEHASREKAPEAPLEPAQRARPTTRNTAGIQTVKPHDSAAHLRARSTVRN